MFLMYNLDGRVYREENHVVLVNCNVFGVSAESCHQLRTKLYRTDE